MTSTRSIQRLELELKLARLHLELAKLKAALHPPGTSEEILECFRAGIRDEK